MRNPKYIFTKVGLLALLWFPCLNIQAQNIADKKIHTGHVGDASAYDMEIYHDSLVIIANSEKKHSGIVEHKLLVYRAADLSIKNIINIDSSYTDYGLLSLSSINKGYLVSAFSYQLDSVIVGLYKFSADLSTFQLQFKRTFNDYYINNARIIDGELYTMLAMSSDPADTVRIEVLDMNGNTLRNLKNWVPPLSLADDSTITEIYSIGPFQHPNKPDRIVYGNRYMCRIIEVDKQSLELKYVMPKEPISWTFGPTYIYGYQMYPDKIVCGGTVSYVDDPFGTNYIMQSYFRARSWNGDSLQQRKFGDINVAERSYAFYSNIATGTHFLGSAAPFFQYPIAAAEYRTIVIHRFNKFGSDSITLYGNKNHVPAFVRPAGNGDLFVLSTYTDAWTTDSTYLVLTKIPGYALSLIDQNKVSPNIQFYPNPTKDILMVKNLMGTVTEVAIYDQQGKLHLQTEVTGSGISLKNLRAGIYIAVVTTKDGQKYSSIVQKE